MADNESAFYNAVAVACKGDYHRIKKLKERSACWAEAFEIVKNEALFPEDIPDSEKAYGSLLKFGIKLLLNGDADYPRSLSEIPNPPFGIYIRSERPAAEIFCGHPHVAIVGTRRATASGKNTAHSFARELCRARCIVVSGLAFGIDASAHEGALESSINGSTIAVLPRGLDGIFPGTHEKLAARIIANGGTLISEYPIGEPAYPSRFIERNRIVSGISRGTIVIEAPERSGAMATARFTIEQNRDLFVVPGPITHSHFKGSHALIRQGAELVTAPEEIFEAYGIERNAGIVENEAVLSPQEILILKALRSAKRPISVDKIIEAAKLEPRIVAQTISFLLIKNVIKEIEEGYTI